MDHAFIDANSVAERYLNHSLTPEELRAFEEHTVDCQECADRLLLAEMFHARNGHKPKADPASVARITLYKPKRLLVILLAAASIPVLYAVAMLIWR